MVDYIADAFAVMAGDKEIARLSSLGQANAYALEVHQSKRFIEVIKQRCREKVAPATREKRVRWLKHILRCRRNGLGAKGIHIRAIFNQ